MNKYLEKLASSKVDTVIHGIAGWGDRLIGHSASKAKTRVQVLRGSTTLGGGIPQSTLRAAEDIHREEAKKSLVTRVKTLLTAGGVGTAGYIGAHKYQQHKDNKIMKQILASEEYNNI